MDKEKLMEIIKQISSQDTVTTERTLTQWNNAIHNFAIIELLGTNVAREDLRNFLESLSADGFLKKERKESPFDTYAIKEKNKEEMS